MDMSKFSNLGKNISSSFSPFAARTGQFMREQLGQAEDKTQLPADYLELEKRVDSLKQVHQQLLQVTYVSPPLGLMLIADLCSSQYGNEVCPLTPQPLSSG